MCFFSFLAATLFICILFIIVYSLCIMGLQCRLQIVTLHLLSCTHNIKCAVVASGNVKGHHFISRTGRKRKCITGCLKQQIWKLLAIGWITCDGISDAGIKEKSNQTFIYCTHLWRIALKYSQAKLSLKGLCSFTKADTGSFSSSDN